MDRDAGVIEDAPDTERDPPIWDDATEPQVCPPTVRSLDPPTVALTTESA